MAHLVTAIFKDSKKAGEAVSELKEAGYTDDISLIAVDKTGEIKSHQIKQDIADGTIGGAAIGGVTGGLIGLLATVGATAVPGIGMILVAGPLAAAWGLTGAAGGALAGGLVGALVDAGIPENRAQEYADAVKRGEVLVTVTGNHDSEPEILEIFNRYGVSNSEIQHQAV